MSVPSSGRRAVEELWRLRLKNAEFWYTDSREQLKKIVRDLPPGEIPPPDGNYAYQQAIRAERLSLTEYTRVLRIFTDLVVKGKMPDEGA